MMAFPCQRLIYDIVQSINIDGCNASSENFTIFTFVNCIQGHAFEHVYVRKYKVEHVSEIILKTYKCRDGCLLWH